jgi:hypothetical protein
MGRIDVGKLKGKYYNNDKDNYYETSTTLSDIKTSVSATDCDSWYNVDGYDAYNDSEEIVVNYIKSQPFSDYNNMLDENGQSMSKVEMLEYFLKTYIEFQDEMSVSFVLLTFCDYFNINYLKIIKDLPNAIQLKLYHELSKYTRNPELGTIFSFDIDFTTPRLF